MSPCEARETAASAVSWCRKKGGVVEKDDTVKKIANVGGEGLFPGNAERDLHRVIWSFGKRLGARIETVPVRVYDHNTAQIVWKNLECIFPDSMAEALLKRGDHVFRHCMLGRTDAAEFWKHLYNHSEWFRRHPASGYPNLSRLVPISLYGDDVQCYKNSEIGTISIIGWTSDFASGNDSLTRYFPCTLWSEHCSTRFTHEDALAGITARLKNMVDPQCLFEWSSTGYCFMMSSIQGDLKWIHDQYNLFPFNKNAFCSLCGCVKQHINTSMTFMDFREGAQYWNSPPDLTNFEASRFLASIGNTNLLLVSPASLFFSYSGY